MAALLGLRRNRVRPHSDRIAALEPRASTSRITTSATLRCMGSVHRPRRSLHWILGAGLVLGCGEDPEAAGDNLMFHDGNDRNLERVMQDLAENALAFRLASELFRKEHDILRSAIRERP